MKKLQRLSQMAINSNRSTAQSLRAGENPLNGSGLPLTCNDEGEEIVCSHMKIWGLLIIKSISFVVKFFIKRDDK